MFGFLLRRLRRGQLREEKLALAFSRLIAWVLIACAAHILAMVWLEEMRFMDAVWLTATTITTVGYGDLSAKTDLGRLATVVLIYAGGIFVLAQAVGVYVDWRSETREKKALGAWDWKHMKNHLILIGEPSGDCVQHIARLIDQVRSHEDWADIEVGFLTNVFADGRLPSELADRGVFYVAGLATDPKALAKIHPETARAILVFSASESDRDSDARVLDTVIRVREVAGPAPLVVAECVEKADKTRLQTFGASQVIRPMHGYPEMASRALISPGAEELIENLFTTEGDECRRYDLPGIWTGPWLDLMVTLVGQQIGTPIGCLDEAGKLISNPVGQTVSTKTIFVVVGDAKQPTARTEINQALFSGRLAA